MSLICLGVVESLTSISEKAYYSKKLETIAKHHKRGIRFTIDWSEPIISHIQDDAFVISILDCPETDNCELFLLPDGWYYNGKADHLAFYDRMKLLQDISDMFIYDKYSIEWYFGLSGILPEEFPTVVLKVECLTDYLTQTIGIDGADAGLHIRINPNNL